MTKKRSIIIGAILVCLIGIGGIYKFIDNKAAFAISELEWKGETTFWTDNSKYNLYNIKFETFSGISIKEVLTKKPSYDMNINFTANNGELALKVYNDTKTLFESKDSINKTISIPEEENKNVKIRLVGKHAKGNIKIKLA